MMSTFLLIPMNEQGGFLDNALAAIVNGATTPPLEFSDMFVFSHGWWTNANAAMVNYDQFNVGFARCLVGDPFARSLAAPKLGNFLASGVHWPSVLTEDRASVLNYAQALTFFTMRARADSVGENGTYAVLRRALEAGTVQHIHLIGHSFGCRVVCSALQKLLTNAPALLTRGNGVDVRVVLLQAAFDQEDLEPDVDGQPPNRYSLVLLNPNIRVLITRSRADLALSAGYPMANLLGDVVNHPIGALIGSVAGHVTSLLGDVAQAAGALAGKIAATVGSVLRDAHVQAPRMGVQVQTPPAEDVLEKLVGDILGQGGSTEAVAARIAMETLHAAGHDVALATGGVGLRPDLVNWLTARGWYAELGVGADWRGPDTQDKFKKVIVADLTDLQTGGQPVLTDHHSDIYRNEIYRLIAWVLFNDR